MGVQGWQHLALLRWVWPCKRSNGPAQLLTPSVWLQAIHLHANARPEHQAGLLVASGKQLGANLHSYHIQARQLPWGCPCLHPLVPRRAPMKAWLRGR